MISSQDNSNNEPKFIINIYNNYLPLYKIIGDFRKSYTLISKDVIDKYIKIVNDFNKEYYLKMFNKIDLPIYEIKSNICDDKNKLGVFLKHELIFKESFLKWLNYHIETEYYSNNDKIALHIKDIEECALADTMWYDFIANKNMNIHSEYGFYFNSISVFGDKSLYDKIQIYKQTILNKHRETIIAFLKYFIDDKINKIKQQNPQTTLYF